MKIFKALRRYFLQDLPAGFLIFLFALPMSLAISQASGFPVVAGVVTALVGSLVATLRGGAPLTIKGPAAGMLVIAVGAVQGLGGGDASRGYKLALAAIVIAAGAQVLMAVTRAGGLVDMVPRAVVHGMLSAIGVIIVAQQVHVMLGVRPEANTALGLLAAIPHSLSHVDLKIALIAGLSFLIVALWPKAVGPIRLIPTPVVALIVAIALSRALEIAPSFLLPLPQNLFGAFARPDFGSLGDSLFWKYVIIFALVGSVESLLTAKEVDAVAMPDTPASMNKELFAIGIGNVLCGMLGGLPMISERLRSTASVAIGAKASWVSVFKGAFLLGVAVAAPFLLRATPLPALAAMLVYAGLSLAAPQTWLDFAAKGWDQLAVFLTTLLVALTVDLLAGVACGLVLELALRLLQGASPSYLLAPKLALIDDEPEHTRIRVMSAVMFTNFPALRRVVYAVSEGHRVTVDLGGAPFVDASSREGFEAIERDFLARGKSFLVEVPHR